MKSYYHTSDSHGYRQYIQEIQNYAALTAAFLGHPVTGLDEEGRIRLYHSLLQEHPYAYPLALELSLYMPPLTAIDWINDLRKAYYPDKLVLSDVRVEMETFLLWRMRPMKALLTAVEHLESYPEVFPSVMRYLEEHHPLFAEYVRARKDIFQGNDVPRSRRYLSMVTSYCCNALRNCLLFLSNRPELHRNLLVYYIVHDSPEKLPVLPWWKKGLLQTLMRIISPKGSVKERFFNKDKWTSLPQQPVPASMRPEKTGPAFFHVTVICGDAYVDRFLDLNLPSLLAVGNLKALDAAGTLVCLLYTTQADKNRLQNAPGFAALCRTASVRFVLLDSILDEVPYQIAGTQFEHKYLPMIAAHAHARKTAIEADGYLVYNFPDTVLQEDHYTQLVRLILDGKTSLFFHAGPSIVEETFRQDMQKKIHNGVLALPHDELNALIANHPHPYRNLLYENSQQRQYCVSALLHDVTDEGYLVNATCITPIVHKPDRRSPAREGAFDWQIDLNPFSRMQHIHIFRDNLSLCLASTEPRDGLDNAMRFGPFTPASFAAQLRSEMFLFNRLFFSLPLRFYHTGTPTQAVWDAAERQAAAHARHILQLGSGSYALPPIEYFLQEDMFLPLR